MDIFSRVSLLVSSILSLVFTPAYIEIDFQGGAITFNDGDSYPIIRYVNVKNIGPERARFRISANAEWIFAYREQQPSDQTVEMSPGAAVNFVLEIRAEQAPNGENKMEGTIEVTSINSSVVLDRQSFPITLNKNWIQPIATPTPTATTTPSPTVSGSQAPLPSTTPTPTKTTTSITPTPSLIPRKTASVTAAPRDTGNATVSPSPLIKPAEETITPSPLAEPTERFSLFKSIWSFLKKIFFR